MTFVKPGLAALALTIGLTQAAQASPICAEFTDPDALPKKYRRLAPVLSSTDTGWIFTQDQLGMDYALNSTETKLLAEIGAEFALRGVGFAILMPPPRPVVADPADFAATAAGLSEFEPGRAGASFHALVAQVGDLGIVMPDLLAAALADPAARDGYYFRRDTHWTPMGAALSARALSASLKTARPDLFPDAIGADFVPVPAAEEWIEKGSLAAIGRKACDADPAPETVPFASLPDRAAGLLDDTTAKPRVALAGSSFSDRYQKDAYRVADALAAFLDAEVENFSVTGGGAIGAIEGLVSSGKIDAGGFDMVIWEVPYTGGFTTSGMRQLLGALQAARHSGTAAMQVTAGSGTTVIDAAKLGTPPQLLQITNVATGVERITVKVDFADRKAKTYKLVRKSRVPTDLRGGDWAVSLSHMVKGEITAITLTPGSDAAGMVVELY